MKDKNEKKNYRCASLTKLENVRRELVWLYNQHKQGKVESRSLRDSVYTLNAIADLIKDYRIEQRIDDLEDKIKELMKNE